MKTCKGCKYAMWHETKGGRLHPSGDGMCTYPYMAKVPPLPASMYWVGGAGGAPLPYGGGINRHRELNSHCVYWSKA